LKSASLTICENDIGFAWRIIFWHNDEKGRNPCSWRHILWMVGLAQSGLLYDSAKFSASDRCLPGGLMTHRASQTYRLYIITYQRAATQSDRWLSGRLSCIIVSCNRNMVSKTVIAWLKNMQFEATWCEIAQTWNVGLDEAISLIRPSHPSWVPKAKHFSTTLDHGFKGVA
jgi:hypothetical protein